MVIKVSPGGLGWARQGSSDWATTSDRAGYQKTLAIARHLENNQSYKIPQINGNGKFAVKSEVIKQM